MTEDLKLARVVDRLEDYVTALVDLRTHDAGGMSSVASAYLRDAVTKADAKLVEALKEWKDD